MRNGTGFWLVVIVAITALSLYMIWPDNPGLFGRPVVVRSGLDVQGGLRVLMTAQQAEGVTTETMEQVRRVIDRRVNALGVAEPTIQIAGTNRIIVELPGVQDPQTAIEIIQQTALLEFVNFSAIGGCTSPMPNAGQYVLTDRQVALRSGVPGVVPTAEATAGATAEATSAATTEATLEPTAEPTREFFRPAQGTVTAEPTLEPTAAATAAPTAEATLEPTAAATAASTAEPTAEPTATATAEAPAAPGSKNNPLPNPCTGQPFQTIMTGAGLQTAAARIGGQANNQYVVSFQLNTANPEAQAFATHTRNNVQQPMAIVLDGEVLSAPIIQSELPDGGEITGNFTQEEANRLALQLRSGALPVSLNIESLEQIGASLGAESVQQAARGGLIGLLAIFLFLLIYYRLGGLAAALAAVVFALLNFALYKFIPVTLTLSAITGFLISIGSAIDGNILIFERVKEELRAGKPISKAVETGFNRAWLPIRDSNISTIMIAAVLYFFGGQFGASAVRGFSVTLIIGLLLNLFTAIIVTRVFLEVLLALFGERLRNVRLFGQ